MPCSPYANPSRIDVDHATSRVWEHNNWPPNGEQLKANPPSKDSYEYIIVGSGAGGSPLAARLALAGHSVLLIDAGGDHGRMREVEVPAMSIWSSERPELSWGFYTRHYEDDETAKRDRKLTYRTPDGQLYSGTNPPEGSEILGNYYPRVGGLGGCTQHNAMLAILPANNDWKYIQTLTGDDSWAPENMRNYYKKLEKNQYPLPSDFTGAHGYSGWLSTAVTPLHLIAQDVKVISLVVAACSAIGIKTEGFLGETLKVIDKVTNGIVGKVRLNDLRQRHSANVMCSSYYPLPRL
jgi:choline dehydrogenase